MSERPPRLLTTWVKPDPSGEGLFYDGPRPTGHAMVAIVSILGTAALLLTLVPLDGSIRLTVNLAVAVVSVPVAAYLGHVASKKDAFLARIIPASVGASTLLFTVSRQGTLELGLFLAAIVTVLFVTVLSKSLHLRYGKPTEGDDADDLRDRLSRSEAREQELRNELTTLQNRANGRPIVAEALLHKPMAA